MKLDRAIRIVIAALILLVFFVGIAAIIFLTESALNVWDRLLAGPRFILYGYVGAMLALFVAVLWLIWRLLVRRKRPAPSAAPARPLTREEIGQRLADAEAAGVDVGAARAELEELAARQRAGAVHLCFFGEISTGKSALIKALVPAAEVTVDVLGGSTTGIRHYHWKRKDAGEVQLTDVPGIGGHAEGLDRLAAEEAQRAQIVLFVCDGDLNRNEARGVERLLALGKPLILVLNKSDRYDVDEQAAVMRRLLDRLEKIGGEAERDRIVAVSAGGAAEVLVRGADGSEAIERRHRAADVGVLVVAINRLLEGPGAAFDEQRDRAVFRLAADKLDEAERQYRRQRAEQVIRSATRRAVVGSLAAVSPGTDILIQGYVGTVMTRELCKLYGAAPRDLDIEEFLNLSQSRVGRALPLSLAVAGNGLKAFPGVGTVAGGLVHAVAYGLIFDALGRSLVQTLSRHGELVPEVAAAEFEEGIGEHIEAGVRQVVRMALDESRAES
jgi:GTP-binding protein EngB required for normal cell division/uncharacterized protein (DUF697 family)